MKEKAYRIMAPVTCGPSANQGHAPSTSLTAQLHQQSNSAVTTSGCLQAAQARLRDYGRAKTHLTTPLCPGHPPAGIHEGSRHTSLVSCRNKQIGSRCYPSLIPGYRARGASVAARPSSHLWQPRHNNRRSRLVW